MRPPRRGCLLVAAPTLEDPNFRRAVVLLLAYDEAGALGVVLNRPSETPLAEIVPSWAAHASTPDVLFSGGPVQQNAAICVGRPDVPDGEAGLDLEVPHDLSDLASADGEDSARDPDVADGFQDDDLEGGYSPLTSLLGTVDLHREPEDVAVALAGLRVFKGYAGWGAGQLEEEIEAEAWFVLDGSPDDVLTPNPEGLWAEVLRRQGGWLAVLSHHPLDPSLN